MRRIARIALVVTVAAACAKAPEPDARFVSNSEIRSFDPVFAGDSYAVGALFQVYETLVELHPFKRPVEMMPSLATSWDESPDHLVFTFHLRDDAFFQDDACFPGGKGRKVTAQDFVWCFKRLMAIPTSNVSWIFAGKIKGMDDWAAAAGKELAPLFDPANRYYPFEANEMRDVVAQDLPGLRALDDRTLRIELSEVYPQFLWTLTMAYVYPHEAVEHWGMEFQNHPVGCGPYHVDEFWIFDHRITFERNPTWHGQTYPTEGAPGDKEAGRLDDAGKKLPFLDRVELVVIPESQPRWLEFLDRRIDYIETEKEIWERAMTPDAQLRPDLVAMGVRVEKEPIANIAYTGFNMEDAVIGAPAGEKGKKLRQAMSLASDVRTWIDVMRNGHWGVPAFNPIPPNVHGYVDVKSPYARYDVAAAKRLLAEAGCPEGRGLPQLHYDMYGNSTLQRNGAEIFKNQMKEIGIDVDLIANTGDQFIAKQNAKNVQITGQSYSQDYPDAQDFLQLFYGPNEAPGPNSSNYKNADYDALYKRMSVMQDSPERDVVIRKMVEILNDDCPWIYQDLRTQHLYCQPWLRNFKYSDIALWMFKYYRVDADEKARRLGRAGAER